MGDLQQETSAIVDSHFVHILYDPFRDYELTISRSEKRLYGSMDMDEDKARDIMVCESAHACIGLRCLDKYRVVVNIEGKSRQSAVVEQLLLHKLPRCLGNMIATYEGRSYLSLYQLLRALDELVHKWPQCVWKKQAGRRLWKLHNDYWDMSPGLVVECGNREMQEKYAARPRSFFRLPSAYHLFQKDAYTANDVALAGLSFGERIRLIALRWKTAPPDTKKRLELHSRAAHYVMEQECPAAPKKRKRAFYLFYDQERPKILQEDPSSSLADVMRTVSHKWEELGEDGRKEFRRQEKRQKKESVGNGVS